MNVFRPAAAALAAALIFAEPAIAQTETSSAQVAAIFELIEVDSAEAAALLNPLAKPPTSAEIYANVLEKVDSGDARRVNFAMLRMSLGQWVETESVHEFIVMPMQEGPRAGLPVWLPEGYIETYNLGENLRVKADLDRETEIVRLHFYYAATSLAGFHHDAQFQHAGWIYSTAFSPIIATQHTATVIEIPNGGVAIASIQSALDENGDPIKGVKHLLFVRAVAR
ncbi:MAG: hypothetical protein ACI8UO_006336 [Verrucomicrobiales bacterium]|jgi:hypothetical protein